MEEPSKVSFKLPTHSRKEAVEEKTASSAPPQEKETARRRASHTESNARHCLEEHNGEEQRFQMSVSGSYRDDAMLRQIAEAVQIENSDTGSLMNDRAEWNMTPVPQSTITT